MRHSCTKKNVYETLSMAKQILIMEHSCRWTWIPGSTKRAMLEITGKSVSNRNTGRPRFPSTLYLRIRSLPCVKLVKKAKLLVKRCLFICKFSIRGPKYQDISTVNDEAHMYYAIFCLVMKYKKLFLLYKFNNLCKILFSYQVIQDRHVREWSMATVVTENKKGPEHSTLKK